MAADKRGRFERRRNRIRNQLRSRGGQRCRLSVFCSAKNLYAQVIDDEQGRTLAAASTLERELGLRGRGNRASAQRIGTLVAERAKAAGVEQVVFDRGGYQYHGRVRELADAARAGGLQF